ncbi:hypothetical protein FGO68_gene16362 [Halteria grandinella]|uniref:Uncharacterized protein n=1 Tax=Halteria grandinella TaxID=5974 RepID=A0A8J8NAM5_HALGN|nr:hypothetical protein FGO68_gene16362 [Halteria grandinella]
MRTNWMGAALVLSLLCIESAQAECLADDADDVGSRVRAHISDVFHRKCPELPQDALAFAYFGMWRNPSNQLVAQQVFFLAGPRSDACRKKVVKALKADAAAGQSPRCSLMIPHRAEWIPNADSGPSILFYMK